MDDDDIARLLSRRTDLLDAAARRSLSYLQRLDSRPVRPTPEDVAQLERFDSYLPATGLDSGEVLALLDDVGSPATMASAGPRFFGFVVGGALPVAVATAWLLDAWDQNGAMDALSPVASRLDEIAVSWIVDLLGLPPGTRGGFVTGTSMANATCLAAARDAVLDGVGWDALGMGLVGAPPVTVLVGEEAHTTLLKALGLVGLGRDRVIRLPVDDQGRVRPVNLPSATSPTILCLQAGNVNSGASDPFDELIDWAGERDAWVHVDGAFGLWAAACPDLAAQVAGVQRADSWATDAHKWLNTTYDCGVALVARPEALAASMRATAAYLAVSETHDPWSYTPQSSQRARGVEVWAVLASLGREGVARLVSRSCEHARRFAQAFSDRGFNVLNDVCLNQVVVDFGGEARNLEVIARIQADGVCWCGPTRWQGRHAMRLSVSCWATSRMDVDVSIAAIVSAALGDREA